MSFHEYPPTIRDNVISPVYWCNHSKVNLDFVPEGKDQITDIRRTKTKKTNFDVAPVVPEMFPLSHPTSGPSSDIWPDRDPAIQPPPNDQQDENPPQIFGDLQLMNPLPPGDKPPPFVSKDHFNSLVFLSRLLKTNDKLTPVDISLMQKLDPHFRQIMQNVDKHKDYSIDRSVILFKQIVSKTGPSFYVLCLPRQFAVSIIQHFHEVSNLHVPRESMLKHYQSRFYTPEIDQLLTASINSCLKCFLTHNSGVKSYKMYKRSISDTSVGEHLQLDLITGLPESSEGYTTLLLIVCVSSHYMIGLPLLDMVAPTISAALNNIFHIIPHPRYLSCDHQPSFTAIKTFCEQNDILCIKSTPSAKNELGSVDSAFRITTQFLQRITTSLDQVLRLNWPKYTKILFGNMNSRYSNRNRFSRIEQFFGPLRFSPNHRMFSSDTFDIANNMLSELKVAQQQKLVASERKNHNMNR